MRIPRYETESASEPLLCVCPHSSTHPVPASIIHITIMSACTKKIVAVTMLILYLRQAEHTIAARTHPEHTLTPCKAVVTHAIVKRKLHSKAPIPFSVSVIVIVPVIVSVIVSVSVSFIVSFIVIVLVIVYVVVSFIVIVSVISLATVVGEAMEHTAS